MQREDASKAVNRRTMLAAAAGAAAAAATPAIAADKPGCVPGPLPHAKGPLVFMNYDQIELDAAYDQSAWAPMSAQIQSRRASNSADVRRRLGNPRRESYGPTQIEKLDIFRTKAANAPTLIFVHGGAWLNGSASEYHFAAEN